jgi:hypothetical protein
VTVFDEQAVAGVLDHMNDDHVDDNLLIARAFGFPDVRTSVMTGFDGDVAKWSVTDPDGAHELVVPWPGAPISERPQVRQAVVLLYRESCSRLGLTPREH